jgi:hypothetical protein
MDINSSDVNEDEGDVPKKMWNFFAIIILLAT